MALTLPQTCWGPRCILPATHSTSDFRRGTLHHAAMWGRLIFPLQQHLWEPVLRQGWNRNSESLLPA